MSEKWKPVKDFEKLYEISNYGRVKSYRIKPEGVILKLCDNGNGYKYVSLSMNGKRNKRYIHRLVAIHFIDNPLGKEEVNHINGDKSKNSVDNLEWVNSSENKQHALNTGLMGTGEKHYAAKLTYEKVKEIRELAENSVYNNREIGEMFGVSRATIWDITSNRTWNYPKM